VDWFTIAETALTLDRVERPTFWATQSRASCTLTLNIASRTNSGVRVTVLLSDGLPAFAAAAEVADGKLTG
jgi:hypothetical protein